MFNDAKLELSIWKYLNAHHKFQKIWRVVAALTAATATSMAATIVMTNY